MLPETGPVVWLKRLNVYAVTRYDDVRRVLRDAEAFCSGLGVGLNDVANNATRGTTLASDGDTHHRFRRVIGRPMTPKALADLRPSLQDIADDLVDRLVSRGSFDAVTDLAEVIPSNWVPDLLGWPEDGREHLLRWGRTPSTSPVPPTSEPHRSRNAFNEVLRVESPLTGFTRVATPDSDIGGVRVAEGSRVLILYASANRDERRWERPDEFDITRDASGQLAFGYGVHACAGMGLARLEAEAILDALVPRVERFVVGRPTRRPNNLIRAFASLPVTVQPA